MTTAPRAAAPAASAPTAPLSVAQEALFYRAFLAPTALTYNEAISLRKDGPLDVPALRHALEEIVRRHEAWRTTFDTIDGEPVQIVRAVPTFDLPVLDLSALTGEQAERRAAELVAETARVPYDLRHGPLLRPRLIRFSPHHHRLYLAMHHLIFDGVSLTRVVLPELAALYGSFSTGVGGPLESEPVRYADFARWQQAWVDQPRLERRLEYWRRRLGSAPELSLALDRPRPPAPASRGGALGLTVPAETVGRLRVIAQQAAGTLFQALAAIWSLLLAAHSGQDDVVFAVAADMRQRPEFQALVGCAITPLTLRLDVSGDPTFAELVVRARNELLDGLDNVVPFERLVRDRHLDGTGANPIYQTMLVLEPTAVTPDPSWSVHQIDSRLADAVGAAKLDLELQLDERPEGGLSGQLIYDRQLFGRDTAFRFVDHWLGLADAVSLDPGAAIGRLSLLTRAEEQRFVVEVNATRTERSPAAVHDLVRERARHQPRAIAVSDISATIDYGDLDRAAQEAATRLVAAGALPGEVETLVGEPSVDLVVLALGALKVDAIPRWPAGEPVTAERVAAQSPAGQLCGLLATAGGRPVALSHTAAVSLAQALAAGLDIGAADTVLVLPSTLARDPISAVWMGLIAGARIVLAGGQAASDGRRLRSLIVDEEVTFIQASPREWRSLIDTGLRSVRGIRALSAGERLSRDLADEILDRCQVLWTAYGRAETSGHCTLAQVPRVGPVTIGRPLANTRAYVLDRHRRPVPVGAPGELVVAGDGIVTGYLDDGGDEDNRFIADPFVVGGRAFRTGERVRWRADGQLEPALDA